MKKVFSGAFVGFASVALVTVALATAGCASNGTPTGGGPSGDNSGGVASSGGSSNGSGGSSTGSGGAISSSSGGASAGSGGMSGSGGTITNNGGRPAATGGAPATGGASGTGGNNAATGGEATGGAAPTGGNAATGGATLAGGNAAIGGATLAGGNAATGGKTTGGMMGSGGTATSNGGSSTGTGGTITSTGGSTGSGIPKTTADIIGPGGATSGNVNGTHGDSWICLLNYPKAGENVTGAWFAYSWTAAACQTLTVPGGGGPPLCFKGGNCTGATPGAGLGFSVCDVHGVNTSTWPQMQALITTGGLSTTTASTFSQCNAGAKITGVNWTLASGSIPAGMSIDFSDVSDQPLGSVTNVAAGATSVSVPTTFDASKIARIKFQMNGSVIKTWDFCFQKLTLSYQ
jgi:hypothetical protein